MTLCPAKPVRSRRCPATVMPLLRGRARTPGPRQRPVLGGRADRFDASSVSQRTRFVLHEPTEDDYASSCQSPACPCGRCCHGCRVRGMRQLRHERKRRRDQPASQRCRIPGNGQRRQGAVHITSRPTSIISLSPTATEMLYAIGAGSQVKAVDDDSDYPSRAPRTKLSGFEPNVEAIVSYKPDLVVISDNVNGLAKRLAAFSIPVLELPAPANVSGVYSQFDELGSATGHLAQAAQEDTSLRSQVKHIIAAVPHHPGPLTYYYELDQTYYSATSGTFVGQLLGLLGMKSIADAAKGAAAAS